MSGSFFNFFLLSLLLYCVTDFYAVAQELPAHNPRVCTGKRINGWGLTLNSDCPVGHAFYSQCCRLGGVSSTASGEQVAISGSCCPLPASDILLSSEQLIVSSEMCPDNYVITGGRTRLCQTCPTRIVCTKVNLARYRLDKPQRGVDWGLSSNDWMKSSVIFREDIPWALRYGVGRESKWRFGNSGCISRIPGSLFVGRRSKHCKDYYFSQLQFAGISNDPPRGTAVRMFPNCFGVTDPFLNETQCIYSSSNQLSTSRQEEMTRALPYVTAIGEQE